MSSSLVDHLPHFGDNYENRPEDVKVLEEVLVARQIGGRLFQPMNVYVMGINRIPFHEPFEVLSYSRDHNDRVPTNFGMFPVEQIIKYEVIRRFN